MIVYPIFIQCKHKLWVTILRFFVKRWDATAITANPAISCNVENIPPKFSRLMVPLCQATKSWVIDDYHFQVVRGNMSPWRDAAYVTTTSGGICCKNNILDDNLSTVFLFKCQPISINTYLIKITFVQNQYIILSYRSC